MGRLAHRVNETSREYSLESGQEPDEMVTQLDNTTGSALNAAAGPKDLLQIIPRLVLPL